MSNSEFQIFDLLHQTYTEQDACRMEVLPRSTGSARSISGQTETPAVIE
jgi:hypothetical protein